MGVCEQWAIWAKLLLGWVVGLIALLPQLFWCGRVALWSADWVADFKVKKNQIVNDNLRISTTREEIIEKMVIGRLRKFYQEVVLTEQTWVLDGETKVAVVLEQAGKDLGTSVKIDGFIKYVLGEGIVKEETDFAAEGAAQVSR